MRNVIEFLDSYNNCETNSSKLVIVIPFNYIRS